MDKRIFVEKKPEFAVLAHDLKEEIASYLGIDTITDVRVLIRYDIEDVSEDAYQKALITIFSEPPVDFVYEEAFPSKEGDTIFSVEFLPGQFDQRADGDGCSPDREKSAGRLMRQYRLYSCQGASAGDGSLSGYVESIPVWHRGGEGQL